MVDTLQTYRGNCHCGAFVYEAEVPEIKTVHECNCSICYKKGYLFARTNRASFKVVKGDEAQLTAYEFGGGNVQHKVRFVEASPMGCNTDSGLVLP